MSTAVEDGAVQRTPGGEEQGLDQGVWQVLSWAGVELEALDFMYQIAPLFIYTHMLKCPSLS